MRTNLVLIFTLLFTLAVVQAQSQLSPPTTQGLQQYQKALHDTAIFTQALKLSPQEKVEALLYLDTLVRCKNNQLYQQKTEKANKLLAFVAHHANELQKLTSPRRGVISTYEPSLPQQFILEAITIVQQVKNNTPETTASPTPTTLKIAYNNAIDRLHTIILYQTQQLNDTEFQQLTAHTDQLTPTSASSMLSKGLSPKATLVFKQLETLYRSIINKSIPAPLQKSAQELAHKFVQHAKEALISYRQMHLPY